MLPADRLANLQPLLSRPAIHNRLFVGARQPVALSPHLADRSLRDVYLHPDRRFEWIRQEFHDWATGISARFGYSVRFLAVGAEHREFGPPTQMAVFDRKEESHGRFP
jgi:hypothetical protein